MRRARLPGMVAIGAMLALLATAPAGAFQLRSCVSASGAGPCTKIANAFAITEPSELAISPDGKSLYEASSNGLSLGEFARDPGNFAIAFTGCLGAMSYDLGCTKGPSDDAFDQIEALLVSPDGAQVYTGAYVGDTIAVLDRDATTGALTFASCLTVGSGPGCTKVGSPSAISGPDAFALSPDGGFLYVAAGFGHADAVFQRDPSSGALTYRGCIGDSGSTCTPVSHAEAMNVPAALAISPDGKFLYSAASTGNAIAVFSRDVAGALTFASCVALPPTSCDGPNNSSLLRPDALAISPDGKQLYSAAFEGDAIAIFDRDASTGALTYAGCVAPTSAGSCDPIGNASALDGPAALLMTPDGSRLYVAAYSGNAIGVFDRDTATGALQFEHCLSETGAAGCFNANNSALHGPAGLALSPDGRELDVAARAANAIATIGFEPVSCRALDASTAVGAALQVQLPCVDPDGGDPLSYVLSKPAHGQLGAVDSAAGTVLYAPDPGFSGADGFDVTATDPEGTSTARVAIQVVGLGASADTKAPELSASLTHRRFRVGRAATAIAAKRAPVGTTFRWRLSEPATVRLVFSRTARGRRVGKRCVKPTQRNAGRRLCRRTIAEGALTRASGVGAGRLAFSGRVGRRALRVGVHRARLVATDAAQNRSKPVVLSFRIVRR